MGLLNEKRFPGSGEGYSVPTRDPELEKRLVGSPAPALTRVEKKDSWLPVARLSSRTDRLCPCE